MKRLLLASLFVLCGRLAGAQDYEAMGKWTAATVVHYRIVGEFSARTSILPTERDFAPVTDRVEIEFDWNQQENKLVGKPVIRNFASKTGAVQARNDCPATKVGGAFEFSTLLGLKEIADENARMAAPRLIMEVRRDYPAGEVPLLPNGAAGVCGGAWEKVAAKSVTESETLAIPLAMLLAMGKMGGEKISPDGKSIIADHSSSSAPAPEGWTLTFTPTIVK